MRKAMRHPDLRRNGNAGARLHRPLPFLEAEQRGVIFKDLAIALRLLPFQLGLRLKPMFESFTLGPALALPDFVASLTDQLFRHHHQNVLRGVGMAASAYSRTANPRANTKVVCCV